MSIEGRFGIASRYIACESQLDKYGRAVYVALTTFAADDRTCWPGTKALAAMTGFSRKKILAGLNQLIEGKYAEIEYRPGKTSIYRLLDNVNAKQAAENPEIVLETYGFVSAAILMTDTLSAHAKACYRVLAVHANKMRVAWPSVNDLVRETGFSKASVHRGLRELQSEGIVLREARHRGDPNWDRDPDFPDEQPYHYAASVCDLDESLSRIRENEDLHRRVRNGGTGSAMTPDELESLKTQFLTLHDRRPLPEFSELQEGGVSRDQQGCLGESTLVSGGVNGGVSQDQRWCLPGSTGVSGGVTNMTTQHDHGSRPRQRDHGNQDQDHDAAQAAAPRCAVSIVHTDPDFLAKDTELPGCLVWTDDETDLAPVLRPNFQRGVPPEDLADKKPDDELNVNLKRRRTAQSDIEIASRWAPLMDEVDKLFAAGKERQEREASARRARRASCQPRSRAS